MYRGYVGEPTGGKALVGLRSKTSLGLAVRFYISVLPAFHWCPFVTGSYLTWHAQWKRRRPRARKKDSAHTPLSAQEAQTNQRKTKESHRNWFGSCRSSRAMLSSLHNGRSHNLGCQRRGSQSQQPKLMGHKHSFCSAPIQGNRKVLTATRNRRRYIPPIVFLGIRSRASSISHLKSILIICEAKELVQSSELPISYTNESFRIYSPPGKQLSRLTRSKVL